VPTEQCRRVTTCRPIGTGRGGYRSAICTYEPGRTIPSFFIRNCSVDRFIPSRVAAPRGPDSTHFVSFTVARMCARSVSFSVRCVPFTWPGAARPCRSSSGTRSVGPDELAAKHGLEAWRMWRESLEGVLLLKHGDGAAGSRSLGEALGGLPVGASYLSRILFFAELAEGVAGAAQIAEGLALTDESVVKTEEGWCLAELFRKKAELLLLRSEPTAAAEAEGCFRKALDVARRQDALWWELRSATSLARFYHQQGRTTQARGGIGSCGVPRPSLADYVAVTGPRGGVTAVGEWPSVAYALAIAELAAAGAHPSSSVTGTPRAVASFFRISRLGFFCFAASSSEM
jgi:hypothetical protein